MGGPAQNSALRRPARLDAGRMMSRRWTKTASRPRVLSLPRRPAFGSTAARRRPHDMARLCCDFAAEMVRDHPGRYGLFAPLSMLDIDATLKEIEYVFDTLKADGIDLQTNYGDKWLGDPALQAGSRGTQPPQGRGLCASAGGELLRPSQRRRFPGRDRGAARYHAHRREPVAERHVRAAARHQWLFSHGGGTIPFLAGRIEAFYEQKARGPTALRPTASRPNFAGSTTIPRTPPIRPRWRR